MHIDMAYLGIAADDGLWLWTGFTNYDKTMEWKSISGATFTSKAPFEVWGFAFSNTA